MTLSHGELFAGISGFGLGFERAGIVTRWAVEIDPQCRRVLARHHPDALIAEDVCDVGAHNLPHVDIISGGFPCQDVSVAGKRAGLAGERTGLFWQAIRVIAELRPTVVILENVPGLLSSNRGRDFGTVLDALADIGALDIAWRVLDSQYFGVAQRRRRVFVVADFGGERAAEILALSDGLSGHSAPRREAGSFATTSLTNGLGSGGPDAAHAQAGWLVPILEAGARTNGDGYRDGDGIGAPGDPMYTLQSRHQHAIAFTGKDYGGDAGDIAPTLRAMPHDTSHANGGGQVAVAIRNSGRDADMRLGRAGTTTQDDLMFALQADQQHAITTHMAVRRLTPTETLRLQSFPDDWLDLEPPLSDSAKYRMVGNSVTVNVAAWIGRRIADSA